MKKLILIFFILVFTVCNVSAVVTIGKSFTNYVRAYIEDAGANKYKLCISFMATFKSLPDSPFLQLKMMDDTTIELRGEKTSSKEQQWQSSTYYNEEACFILTQEQFDQIAKGVKKLRLNAQPEYYEKKWKNGEIGKKLYKDYNKSKF